MTRRTFGPPLAAHRRTRPAATRVAAVVLGTTVTSLALLPRVACAQNASPLVLPLLAALAVARQAAEATREQNPIEVRAQPPPSLRSRIPRQIRIPDMYAVHFTRDARRWAEPIDSDNLVALDLWPQPYHGVTPMVSYDQETRFIGDSSDVVSFKLQYRW